MHNWLEIAHARWTNCPIKGDGRWAIQVIGLNGRTREVVLCADEATAKSASHFYDHCFRHDLLAPVRFGRTIPDAYDPEEHRRERRENRG
jgi:hypothetical protein